MMTDINLFVLLPKENKTFGKRTIAKMSKYAVILPNTPKLVANAQRCYSPLITSPSIYYPGFLQLHFPNPKSKSTTLQYRQANAIHWLISTLRLFQNHCSSNTVHTHRIPLKQIVVFFLKKQMKSVI